MWETIESDGTRQKKNIERYGVKEGRERERKKK